MKKFSLTLAAGAVLSCALLCMLPEEIAKRPVEPGSRARETAGPDSSGRPPQVTAPSLASHPGPTSPFGRGEPPPRSAAERVLQRTARMQQGGYSTPPAYFSMSLQELHARAKQNDIFALLQLGEQYWSESEDISSDPAFDSSLSPKEKAIKLIAAAAEHGQLHAATIVTSMYESQGQDVLAYAWALVSQRTGDLPNQDQSKRYENRLTPAQRQQAEVQAEQTGLAIKNNLIEALKRDGSPTSDNR